MRVVDVEYLASWPWLVVPDSERLAVDLSQPHSPFLGNNFFCYENQQK